MATARELNELLQLDDDAFVTTKEAAAFLSFQPESLRWYRMRKLHLSPKFQNVGRRSIRYRMGDLRLFAKNDPAGFHAPRPAEG